MATWNMGQYDSIENDARLIDALEYTRQRQDILDKRAAQDYALRREDDLRKAERAKVNHDYTMRNVSDIQKLADMKRQNELNTLEAAQQEHDFNTALYNDKMLHLGEELELARLKRQKDINTHKIDAKKQGYTLQNFDRTAADAERARQDKEDQLAYSRRTYSPFQNVLLKFKANGNDLNSLSAEERAIAKQTVGYITPEEEQEFFQGIAELTPDELKSQENINPAYVPLYAAEHRAAAAKNAEYQLKNAPAIAMQKQQEQYNTVSGFMTGFYNDAVKSRSVDPKVTKSKDVVNAATRIFIASNGALTPKQAFDQAAGIRAKNTPPPPEGVSEIENTQLNRLYNKRYAKLDDEEKEKLAAVYSEWKEKYQPSPELKGIDYLKAAQQSAVAFRDLLKKNELPDDLNTPIDEELYHLEYDYIYKDLLAREKSLSEEFPRWYKWVKDNPNTTIQGRTKLAYLVDESMYDRKASADASAEAGVPVNILKPEYQKFFDELRKIQELRNQLVNRENWLKQFDSNRRYGKK